MECKCEYCKEDFIPKRTDARFCSHSCRQLAYVLRKAKTSNELGEVKSSKSNIQLFAEDENIQQASINTVFSELYPSTEIQKTEETSINLTDKSLEPSIKQNETTLYPSKEENISVNNEPNLCVNQDEIDNSPAHKSINTPIKHVQEEEKHQYYNCLYLDEIILLTQDRDNIGILYSFLHNKTKGVAFWISLRYRCLLECLLSFSEMQSIELDDLKEVCNAFTGILESKSYQVMIPEYPYKREILWLRDLIKNVCLNAETETLTFRLKKETKIQLIASRWELANYVPKVSFSKLNFQE